MTARGRSAKQFFDTSRSLTESIRHVAGHRRAHPGKYRASAVSSTICQRRFQTVLMGQASN
jgi:hypothetical protein